MLLTVFRQADNDHSTLQAGAEELGVATALERTCMLEARLRQAIQDTHVVSRDYGHDAEAAAHEHSALLNIK